VADFDILVKENVRNGALGYIQNAVGGSFLEIVGPVKTSYYTYEVRVEVERVVK
jgi:hypothetical protein